MAVPESTRLRSTVPAALPRTGKERSDHHLPRWKSQAVPRLRKHDDLSLENLDQILSVLSDSNVTI